MVARRQPALRPAINPHCNARLRFPRRWKHSTQTVTTPSTNISNACSRATARCTPVSTHRTEYSSFRRRRRTISTMRVNSARLPAIATIRGAGGDRVPGRRPADRHGPRRAARCDRVAEAAAPAGIPPEARCAVARMRTRGLRSERINSPAKCCIDIGASQSRYPASMQQEQHNAIETVCGADVPGGAPPQPSAARFPGISQPLVPVLLKLHRYFVAGHAGPASGLTAAASRSGRRPSCRRVRAGP